MLDSDIADLNSRLAFTLNIDSLGGRKKRFDATTDGHDAAELSWQPRSKRRTLRKLIGSRKRLPHGSRGAFAAGQAAGPDDTPTQPLLPPPQSLTLPLITSFSPDIALWDGTSMLPPKASPDVVEAPLPQPPPVQRQRPALPPASCSDDDVVLANLILPLAVATGASKAYAHRPSLPPSPGSSPFDHLRTPSTQQQPAAPKLQQQAVPSGGSTNAPRRDRSLMFKPLLDVTAVGSLIDTISNTSGGACCAGMAVPVADDKRAASEAVPRRRLLGSLRRSKAISRSGTRPGRVGRQRSHYMASMFQRSLGVQGIGLRTLSHEICPIDTTQDDDNNCGAIDKDADVVPPANPAGASAGGAPRTAEPAVPKPQPEMPTVPEKPASPIAQVPPAELPAPADDAKADVAPGLQAATAMMVKAPSTDDTIPGYTPIAVSLKGSRSRQFLLNTPLGEFSVERTLGQGSYGKVKLMRSALTHEQFAVKIIKRFPPHKHRRSHHEYRKAKTLDRRVVREANLAAILGQLHPHIVPLHDFRVTDTHFYLFYAFVNGVTLAERVGGGGLSENEARAVFKPVAETINFCHQYSVIHRDIKLENVLIDYADEARSPWELVSSENSFQPSTLHAHRSQRSSNNMDSAREWVQRRRRSTSGHAALARQRSVPSDTSTEPPDFRAASVFDGRVKLIDFGLANFFDGTSLMDTFCGSLPYTAPEILRGDAYVGPEIDVWSLGVLLYVMHTGSFPFDDPAQPKNFEKIANGDFVLHPSMSRPLQELLVRMLEPSPTRRITMHDVLRHEWLASSSIPGSCCVHHPQPTMGGIHERRTLVLPGPRAHRLIAREVAVCLGRGTDEVTRAIDKALANGTPLPPAEQQPQSRPPRVQSRSRAQSDPPPRSQQHQQQRQQQHREHRQVDTEVWSPLAPLHQWPRELQDLGASGILVEVANSPFVSVYALVLQQIGMRRYYLELPVPEHPHATGADAVSSTSLFAMPGSVPLAPRGLRALDSSPDPSARSRALATRLATQFASLASLTGNLVGGNGGGKHGAQPADPPTEPAYVKPLSMGASMPLLPQSARHGQSPANDASEPYIRTIPSAAAATADDSGTRIPLPNELAGLPASQVLSLVSRLLTMHEIAHTFVETQRMPMHKALNSSMFSLKTVAALMESHQNLSQPADTPDTADTLTSQDMLDVLSGDLATDTEHPERERSQTGSHIRSLLHSMFPRGPAAADSHSGRFSRLFSVASGGGSSTGSGSGGGGPTRRHKGSVNPRLIVHPHLREQPPIPPPPRTRPSAPDIMTTIPVDHPAATILAQYSPSLNRWRETEVVEYYSCSVRIELVRLSPHRRPRYALLVDRMAGHKGKYSLFLIFLRRLAPALPTLA